MEKTNPENPNANTIKLIDLHQPERWQLYQRLQELDIECYCSGCQPLLMHLEGAFSALQAWSAMRQMYCSNDCLRNWLEQCWKIEAPSALH
jgi:hypothetical protein